MRGGLSLGCCWQPPPQLWVPGLGSVFGALRVLRCPIPLFPALYPLFVSLHLAADALSHAGAFFFSSSSFFSPLRLRQAHKMCKCFIFSLSVCFGFGIFYFFIFFFLSPACSAAPAKTLFLWFSPTCVFLMPWERCGHCQSPPPAQNPPKLLHQHAPVYPIDVPKLPSMGFSFSRALGSPVSPLRALERGGSSLFVGVKENLGTIRVMLMLLDGLRIRSSAVEGGSAWLGFPPPPPLPRLADLSASFLPSSPRSKTPVSCFSPPSARPCPPLGTRDAGESPPGPNCTFFPFVIQTKTNQPHSSFPGSFPPPPFPRSKAQPGSGSLGGDAETKGRDARWWL